MECLPEDFLRQAFMDFGEIVLSCFCFSFCCPSGLLFYFFGGVLLSPLFGVEPPALPFAAVSCVEICSAIVHRFTAYKVNAV